MHPAMHAVESRRAMVEHFESEAGVIYPVALYTHFAPEVAMPSLASHFNRSWRGDVEGSLARAVSNEIAKTFRLADSYWVHRDMVSLVNATFDDMPSHPMTQATCPVPFGWMHLEQTVHVMEPDWDSETATDLPDEPVSAPSMSFNAISWRRANAVDDQGKYQPGYEVWFYQDRDAIVRDVRRHMEDQDDERPVKPKVMTPSQAKWLPPYVPVRQFFWRDGQTLPDAADSFIDTLMATWFQAAQILMDMPIAAKALATPERHLGKRMARAQIPVSLITVVTMRTPRQRPKDETDLDHEGREYSHRWIVGHHWRRQFYSKTGEYKVIYIHDFVKGPADKPLIVKQKVNAWVR